MQASFGIGAGIFAYAVPRSSVDDANISEKKSYSSSKIDTLLKTLESRIGALETENNNLKDQLSNSR